MLEADTDGRLYPERPIPAVGGVVVKDRDVLLVMRGKEPGFGEWSIPGGAIGVGESLRQAIAREIREEVGIVVDPVDLLEVLDRIVRDDHGMIRYHYVLLDFLCLYRSGELRAGSDAMNARWVKASDLGGYDLRRETEAVIRKGLEMAHARWVRGGRRR
jgi:8-oxo-dGTP diphosphatase